MIFKILYYLCVMKNCRGHECCQETKRKLVIRYLRNKEGTHEDAARLFDLSKSAVDKIWTRYKKEVQVVSSPRNVAFVEVRKSLVKSQNQFVD